MREQFGKSVLMHNENDYWLFLSILVSWSRLICSWNESLWLFPCQIFGSFVIATYLLNEAYG